MSVNVPDLPCLETELDGLVTVVTAECDIKDVNMGVSGPAEFKTNGVVTKLNVTPNDPKEAFELKFDVTESESSARSSKTGEAGLFKKVSITGSNKGDSVQFSGKTTVQRSTLDMGKGADTVTFGAKTQFVGKTTIDLGPAGGKADKVIFKGNNTPDGGRVVIENFDSKDKLLVEGKVYKAKNLEGMKIDGIKIEFAD